MKRRMALEWGVAGALFATGLWSIFRGALHGQSLGDNSDGGIVLAILEHWVRVFTGQAADWRSPGWYWPAPHALGLSDSLFLLAVPYAAARALGAGWFTANDVATGVMATAGFWGMVLLVRRLGGAVAVGAVVGFVFSFGVVPVFKLGHAQTYTMQLAPMLGLLLVAAWRRAWWAGAAGLLVGLMLFTAAQTPWFLGLEAGCAVLAGGMLAGQRVEWRRGMRLVPWFGMGLAAGMVPFVALYRDSFGLRRDFSSAHFYSGRPWDLFDVPPGEVLWFELLHRVGIAGDVSRPLSEVALGLTPVLAATGVVALVMMVRRRAVGVAALLAAGLLGPMLAVDWGGVEPWALVFWLVPGGDAVRTPFRIELAAQFFLCLGLGLALSRGMVRGGLVRAGLVGLMMVLVAEQIGEKPSGRDDAAMGWLEAARRPGFACDAFYLLPGGGAGPWHQYQADAMLLSERIRMPTVNGNSSFYPEGWDMPFTDRSAYAGKALAWIDAHGARGRVCGVDPRRGLWVEGVGALER